MLQKNLVFRPLFFLLTCLLISNCSWVLVSSDNSKPDLLIADLIYSIKRQPIRRHRFSRPVRPSGSTYCPYNFNVIIENRGASPWEGELIIGYSLSKQDFNKKRYDRYEKITIDSLAILEPQQMQEYSFSLSLHCKTDNMFFVINPEDSGQSKESFYNNNEWVIKNNSAGEAP